MGIDWSNNIISDSMINTKIITLKDIRYYEYYAYNKHNDKQVYGLLLNDKEPKDLCFGSNKKIVDSIKILPKNSIITITDNFVKNIICMDAVRKNRYIFATCDNIDGYLSMTYIIELLYKYNGYSHGNEGTLLSKYKLKTEEELQKDINKFNEYFKFV